MPEYRIGYVVSSLVEYTKPTDTPSDSIMHYDKLRKLDRVGEVWLEWYVDGAWQKAPHVV